jgi:hypothetical protein
LIGANKPIPNGCSPPTSNQKTWHQRGAFQANAVIADGKNTGSISGGKKHGDGPTHQRRHQPIFMDTQKGYYAQFIYGRNFKIVSPKAEALGESLCVLFGIADAQKAASILQNLRLRLSGILVFIHRSWIPPYHNDAVWPLYNRIGRWLRQRRGMLRR